MERAKAVQILSKLLGKNFSYRVDPKASDKAEKTATRAELLPVVAENSRLESLLNERRREVLNADAEYQRIVAELKAIKDKKTRLNSRMYNSKFTVGTVDKLAGLGCFFVKADGDSWEEVIEKVKTNKR